MKKTALSLFFCFILLAVIIGIDASYKKSLFEANIRVIKELQREIKSEFFSGFLDVITTAGQPWLYFTIIIIAFNYLQKEVTFYYIFMVNVGMYITSILKMVYHDPRPYMVSGEIQGTECTQGLGNPSGHSLSSSILYTTLFLHSFHYYAGGYRPLIMRNEFEEDYRSKKPSANKHAKKEQKRRKNKLIYISSLIGLVALISLIGFSRLFKGVHSIDQVIYGWQLGLWTCFVFYFFLRSWMFNHIRRLLLHPSAYYWKAKYFALIAIAVFVIFTLISLLVFTIVDNSFIVPDSWEQNASQECTHSSSMNNKYHAKSFIESGVISFIIGSYLGILAESRMMNGCPQKWNKTKWNVSLLRLIVLAIPCAIFLIPYIFLSTKLVDSLAGLLIVKTMVPFFAVGFFLFGFGKELTGKFGLNNPKAEKWKNEHEEQKRLKLDDTSA